MWESGSVVAPAECKSETQVGVCDDGTIEYNGDFSFEMCLADCMWKGAVLKHGALTEWRIMYKSSTVLSPSTCESQNQTAVCNNGDIQWNGDFSFDSCTSTVAGGSVSPDHECAADFGTPGGAVCCGQTGTISRP